MADGTKFIPIFPGRTIAFSNVQIVACSNHLPGSSPLSTCQLFNHSTNALAIGMILLDISKVC